MCERRDGPTPEATGRFHPDPPGRHRRRPSLYSRLLAEALADVMSHAMTGSPCHTPNPSLPGGCSRRLDVPSVEGTADPYALGQLARFAAWNFVAGKPIAQMGRALLAARDAAHTDTRPFAADLVFGRRATPEEKLQLDALETDAMSHFLAALPH